MSYIGIVGLTCVLSLTSFLSAVEVRGQVVDTDTGQPLPARLYIQSIGGEWYFPRSASENGSALEYRKQYPGSMEMHTTLSGHPFVVNLPPGKYLLTVERGKEYHAVEQKLTVGDAPMEVTLRLDRWIHMAQRGWYSGDTHNHIPLAEVPIKMLAEDLNVAMPITYWVRQTDHSPARHNMVKGPPPEAKLIEVTPGHVIWPVNTEYELVVAGTSHVLGAILIAGHSEPFTATVPPVGPIGDIAHRQGAMIDLDKQNWPWSMMLVPIAGVDLFELSNNHIWRTNFFFKKWYTEYAGPYMNLERDAEGNLTEWGWIEYGFKNYYALLNCGFRLRPTAGTAAGVHPVPLGFGRVYVHLPDGFSYEQWMAGLNAGRSFVTTGPMMEVTFNGKDPGHVFTDTRRVVIEGVVHSAVPLDRIEVIRNGEIGQVIEPQNEKTDSGGYRSSVGAVLEVKESSWAAIRCFEHRTDGRVRFAHTAPVYIDVEGKPLRPRRVEVEYLVKRVRDEIERNRGVLTEQAIAEYERAMGIYEALLEGAR